MSTTYLELCAQGDPPIIFGPLYHVRNYPNDKIIMQGQETATDQILHYVIPDGRIYYGNRLYNRFTVHAEMPLGGENCLTEYDPEQATGDNIVASSEGIKQPMPAQFVSSVVDPEDPCDQLIIAERLVRQSARIRQGTALPLKELATLFHPLRDVLQTSLSCVDDLTHLLLAAMIAQNDYKKRIDAGKILTVQAGEYLLMARRKNNIPDRTKTTGPAESYFDYKPEDFELLRVVVLKDRGDVMVEMPKRENTRPRG